MKKIILTALVALFSFAHHANAQNSLLATLNHEGKVSTFYGATALRAAHAAATHGDIITLSSGTFVSTDITKAITLRGAGWKVDELSHTEPTILEGSFVLSTPESNNQHFVLEGVYLKGHLSYGGDVVNPIFLKCCLTAVSHSSPHFSLINANFVHCLILDDLYLSGNSTESVSFITSAIADPSSRLSSNSVSFQNCIVSFVNKNPEYCTHSTFYNCYIDAEPTINSSSSTLPSSSPAYYCTGAGSYIFSGLPEATIQTNNIAEGSIIFKEYSNSSIHINRNFELKDEAKTKYLGNDGTQIGIYGGSIPFSATPSNPKITKCNVAGKSTADGKLSVEIEVKAAE